MSFEHKFPALTLAPPLWKTTLDFISLISDNNVSVLQTLQPRHHVKSRYNILLLLPLLRFKDKPTCDHIVMRSHVLAFYFSPPPLRSFVLHSSVSQPKPTPFLLPFGNVFIEDENASQTTSLNILKITVEREI